MRIEDQERSSCLWRWLLVIVELCNYLAGMRVINFNARVRVVPGFCWISRSWAVRTYEVLCVLPAVTELFDHPRRQLGGGGGGMASGLDQEGVRA